MCPLAFFRYLFSQLQQGGSQVRKEIPEEGRRAHRPKCCKDINKDEDKSPKNRNTTNYNQTSSHTFREIMKNLNKGLSYFMQNQIDFFQVGK